MKLFTITKSQCQPILQAAEAAQRNGTMPKLQNVHFEHKNDSLFFTGSDMESQIKTHIVVDFGEFDSFTAPAEKLKKIISTLSDSAVIDFSLDKEKLTIKSGKSKFTMAVLPGNDFPFSLTEGQATLTTLDAATLKNQLQDVVHAMPQADIRTILNGAYFDNGSVVATSGLVLALSKGVGEGQFILPYRVVHKLVKLLNDGEVTIEVYENKARFSIDGVEFLASLVQGKYPDYMRVIPNNTLRSVISKDAFMQASARAAVNVAKHAGVKLTFTAGTLEIKATNNGEESSDEIEVEYDGEPYTISVNVEQFRDAVGSLPEVIEVMLHSDTTRAVCLKGGEQVCVVMPMRI